MADTDTDTDTDLTTKTSFEGPSGIATTREDGQTDPDPFLALYSINANRLVRIGSYHSRINDVMRQFRWATLERGDGWYFPEPYLSRVELALCGVDVTLANRDGSPTPAAAAAERRDDNERTKRILDELRMARDAANADPLATRDAREQCRRAYADAIAARHPAGPEEPGQ
jgi:hypothetical protein